MQDGSAPTNSDKCERKSWRDVLPVHPAAEMFPLMSEAELRELAEDIKKNGLKETVALIWLRRHSEGQEPLESIAGDELLLLDGRNRLDALELLGRKIPKPGRRLDTSIFRIPIDSEEDPYAYVTSTNIHRRHLTAEKKREIIATLLKADPTKSDRAVAKTVKADDKTVAKVRRKLEGRSDIPNVKTRTDTKGRKQPAKKAAKVEPEVERKYKAVAAIDEKREVMAVEIERLASRLIDCARDTARELHKLLRDLDRDGVILLAESLGRGLGIDDDPDNAAAPSAPAVADVAEQESAEDDQDADQVAPRPCKRKRPNVEETDLADAINTAFEGLAELAGECREVVDNAPVGISETERIQTLDETASVLEGLEEPNIADELADIKVEFFTHRARSRAARRDAALGIIEACVCALSEIGENDPRHEAANDLRDELSAASVAEDCEFPGMFG